MVIAFPAIVSAALHVQSVLPAIPGGPAGSKESNLFIHWYPMIHVSTELVFDPNDKLAYSD